MAIIWIFLAAGLLYVLQRAAYWAFWDRRLKVRIRFDQAAVTAGEPVTLTERIENRKLLPLPMFSYQYQLSRNLALLTETPVQRRQVRNVVALPAFRAVVNRSEVRGLPRGVYTLTDLTVSSGDLFYTIHPERKLNSYSRITVYPEKIPARKLDLPYRQMLGTVLTKRYSVEDPFLLRGIRPYEIYDSMRDINWKASARTGELKVNQHEHTSDEGLMLLLDMDSGTEAERETVISLASSLSRLFLNRGVTVSLYANCRSCMTSMPIRVPAGGGPGHQRTVDELLAQIKLSASATQPFPRFLRELPKELLRNSMPVVISADSRQETVEAYRSILGKQRGFFLSMAGQAPAKTERITFYTWNTDRKEVVL